MWKRFVYFVLGIYHQQCNPLTIFTRVHFCMKHWASIYCFDVFKAFVAIHSASPTPARPHQTLKQTTKVIIQADYKTLQQATGHHHKNDRVHIGNCHPAPVEHQHQSPSPTPTHPSPVCSAAFCAHYTSMAASPNNERYPSQHFATEISHIQTTKSSFDWQNHQPCRFLRWHNHLLLFENETEVQIDVLLKKKKKQP